jgi:GAF domain-containing protein
MILSFRSLKLTTKFVLIAALSFLLTIVFVCYAYFYAKIAAIPLLALVGASIVTLLLAIRYVRILGHRLASLRDAVDDLSSGKGIDIAQARTADDELASLGQGLTALHAGLQQKTDFAEQLIAGNLEVSFQAANGEDKLGQSLLQMRETLIRIKHEEQKRIWTNEALARFVDVLRSNENLRRLCNDIIINLVKTLNANQGAIFLLTQESGGDAYLEMQACYAYARTKHLTRRIAPGEGMLGQVFLEKRTAYLRKIPDDFVRITSGLGDAPPRFILITPLKMEEQVVGVIELASFKAFDEHEITFVEKIGESIAHTIISFQTAENTRTLLDESRAQTEQMRAQEEELKQNQEELQATQEEISRKYRTLFSHLTELNHLSKFDQLRSITSTKKQSIEYYFDIIRSQIQTFADNTMIIDAVRAFRESFYSMGDHASDQQLAVMQKSVRGYYEKEFIPKLNDSTDQHESAAGYLPETKTATVLQHLYISDNAYPTGKKSLLEDPGDGSDYSRVHAQYHPRIRSFLEKFGYYDIFLIDAATGDMLYSVFKEVDYATSLLNGRYSTTNFGKVVRDAINSTDTSFVRLVDFEPYAPSYRAPASFIACPVYDGPQKIGILVFQMPINKINQILTGNSKWREDGLGESGETVLIGSDNTLRTVSRELLEHPEAYLASLGQLGYESHIINQIRKTGTNILLEKATSTGVSKALHGATGTLMENNPHGVPLLQAYAPLEIGDVKWMILSTMKESEASERINSLRDGSI